MRAHGENRRGREKINLAVYVLPRTDEEPTSDDMHWLGLLKQNNVPVALFINEINAVQTI